MSLLFRLLAPLLLAAAGPLAAASFTANSSLDLPDDNPGDGVCRSSGVPLSTCTLRAAIMEANALPGSHIINLQSGRTYTLTRSGVDDNALNGDLDITKSLIIWCLGCEQRPVLNVNGVGRGFDIHAGDVTLANFDITGGDATAPAPGDRTGGAVEVRASAGTVVISQMRMYGNRATGAGAVLNDGLDTTISTSEIFDNEIVQNAAGVAILNRGDLLLRRSSLYGNSGIENISSAAVGTLSFAGQPGYLTVESSTISGNGGGGLSIQNSFFTRVFNSTIADNGAHGIRLTGSTPVLTIRNSIIAGNSQGDCRVDADNGAYISSNNLYSDHSCASFAGAGPAGKEDLQGVNPLLTPLKHRSGGTTSTPMHWPRQDSPALSAASGAAIGSPSGCLSVDQNGIARPQGYNGTVRCDIGAAEVPDDAIFFDSLETL